jgi:hypothetical protein
MGPPSSSARTGSAKGTLGARSTALFPHPARFRFSSDAGRALGGTGHPPLQRHSALSQVSLRLELKDPEGILAQEFRPDGIAEGDVGHVAKDPLER